MPKTGFTVLLSSHDLIVAMVSGHCVWGSPGPLLTNRPSKSERWSRMRMLALSPPIDYLLVERDDSKERPLFWHRVDRAFSTDYSWDHNRCRQSIIYHWDWKHVVSNVFDTRHHRREERCCYLYRYLCHQIDFVLILEWDGLRIGTLGDNLFIGNGIAHRFQNASTRIPCRALFRVREASWSTYGYQYLACEYSHVHGCSEGMSIRRRTVKAGHIVLFEPRWKRFDSIPMAVLFRVCTNNQAGCIDLAWLHPSKYAKIVNCLFIRHTYKNSFVRARRWRGWDERTNRSCQSMEK